MVSPKSVTPEIEEKLKEYLKYDPKTGILTWIKKPSKRVKVKSQAGCYDKTTGYMRTQLHGIALYNHRVVWFLYHGTWPQGQVDHKDGDKLNNKISNLRDISVSENNRNKPLHYLNTSGMTGVHYYTKTDRWHVRLKKGSINHFIGSFTCLEEAKKARRQAEIQFNLLERQYHEYK